MVVTATPKSLVADQTLTDLKPVSPDVSKYLGPLAVEDYLRYAPCPPNDPQYALAKIEATFSSAENAAGRQSRTEMWSKYEALLQHTSGVDGEDILAATREFVLANNKDARADFTEPRARLGAHLQEIEIFCSSFYLTPEGRSRFGESLLTDRQANLLAHVAAPLHDLLKYLGDHSAQVMPDHEVMTAELVRRTFTGKQVSFGSTTTTLTGEDVTFIASIIGDHENIEKERGRSQWVSSPSAIERAKACFAVADTLTGAIVTDDGGVTWRIEPQQLAKRFTDLYFRHIDLEKGKIFRPEWGLVTLEDLSTTLKRLAAIGASSIRGTSPDQTVGEALRCSGLEAIEAALSANAARRAPLDGAVVEPAARGAAAAAAKNCFDVQQLARVMRVREQFLAE